MCMVFTIVYLIIILLLLLSYSDINYLDEYMKIGLTLLVYIRYIYNRVVIVPPITL